MYEPQDGEHLFANAFNALIRAMDGVYVDSGCSVSINSGSLGSNDTLTLASGVIGTEGKYSVTVASQNVGIDAASSDGPRFDLVSVDSTGSAVVTKGTVDTTSNPTPAVPAIPSGNVAVAAVYVPEGESSISSNELYDLRAVQALGMINFIQTSEPAYAESRTWVNPDNGVFYAGYDGDYRPVPPATVLDEATAFDGSDGESVNHNDTVTSDGSIQLPTNDTSTINEGSGLNGFNSRIYETGLVFNPNNDLDWVEVELLPEVDSVSRLRVVRDSDGTVISDKTGGPWSAGDVLRVSDGYAAGTDYRIWTDNQGNEYTERYRDQDINYAYSSAYFDVPTGWENGTTSSDAFYAFEYIKGAFTGASGNAVVSWPIPSDLRSWDLATWQRTLDGETVTVDVEDGNGNVLFSDIDQNFDISTVSESKNVQLRVNLSREDLSNNPTIDYLARRHTT